MKSTAKYLTAFVLVILSAFIFKVDDSLLLTSDRPCEVVDFDTRYDISPISTHNDIIIPDNSINLFSAARRLSPSGNVLFKSNFVQESNEPYSFKIEYKYEASLCALNKPQTYYYIYALRKIRI